MNLISSNPGLVLFCQGALKCFRKKKVPRSQFVTMVNTDLNNKAFSSAKLPPTSLSVKENPSRWGLHKFPSLKSTSLLSLHDTKKNSLSGASHFTVGTQMRATCARWSGRQMICKYVLQLISKQISPCMDDCRLTHRLPSQQIICTHAWCWNTIQKLLGIGNSWGWEDAASVTI